MLNKVFYLTQVVEKHLWKKKIPPAHFILFVYTLLVMTNVIALDQIVYSITTLLKLCFLCEYNAVFISFKPVFCFVFLKKEVQTFLDLDGVLFSH